MEAPGAPDIYSRLQFWFNDNVGLAIPLISIPGYIEQRQIKDLEKEIQLLRHEIEFHNGYNFNKLFGENDDIEVDTDYEIIEQLKNEIIQLTEDIEQLNENMRMKSRRIEIFI